MDRRKFLGAAALATAAVGASACAVTPEDLTAATAADASLPEVSWQMATSWPPLLDTIFGGATTFAETVSTLTGGKFTIDVRAAGELAPGLEVLNVVEQGAVQCGHTASYYYVGKSPVTAFGTALPFGLTNRQNNAWFYQGGGLEMMQAFYGERFGVIQFPAGNTGAQMGGWFNKEIQSIADMEGLKMRIPGLGGQVMDRLGVTVQVLPGGEIFQALQTGAIDAAEWVGPYDDLRLNFQQAAKFYYYPGWWEPGPTLEVQVNLDEWNGLPEEYQAAIATAANVANTNMMATYDVKNIPALAELMSSDVVLSPFPDDVMQAAEGEAFAMYDEIAASDPDFSSILSSWSEFRSGIQGWHGLAEAAMTSYQSIL